MSNFNSFREILIDMTEDILVTKSLYDDFSRPTNVRQFEVIIEEQSL